MRVVNENGASTVTHEDVVYEAHDGVFDLPEPVGAYITAYPGWSQEHEYISRLTAEEKAARTEPDILADRIRALEDRVAALESKPKVGRPPKQT